MTTEETAARFKKRIGLLPPGPHREGLGLLLSAWESLRDTSECLPTGGLHDKNDGFRINGTLATGVGLFGLEAKIGGALELLTGGPDGSD